MAVFGVWGVVDTERCNRNYGIFSPGVVAGCPFMEACTGKSWPSPDFQCSDARRAIKEALAKTGADTQSVRASIDDMEGYLLALVPLPAEPSQLELTQVRWVSQISHSATD